MENRTDFFAGPPIPESQLALAAERVRLSAERADTASVESGRNRRSAFSRLRHHGATPSVAR
jgi:hypothetical protein